MRTIKVNYGIEDLKYRIFGLFPYFGKNDDGTMVLYKGNTSPDGCYNKIGCNLILPCDFIVDDTIILSSGQSYSFRTLLNYYRKYINLKDNEFIKFMNRGVGRIVVKAKIDREECDLVPYTVNLVECGDLYDTMQKMSILCDRYINSKKLDSNVMNCNMECLLIKYKRMGGDIMRDYYKDLSLKSDEIATEFFNYADHNPYGTSYKINICFTETIHDIGMADSYTDIWDYTTRYYKGNMIVYNDETYICDGNEVEIDGKIVDEGVIAEYDINKGEYIFDKTKFKTVKEALTISDTQLKEYFFNSNDDKIKLSGKTNSKLKSFRKFGDYISASGIVETPSINEDWLFYYKINAIANHTVIRDAQNNIDVFDKDNRVTEKDKYEFGLYAYGDILTDIYVDSDNYMIIFKYVIGAHLKAKLVEFGVNEFNEPIFKYSDFEYDDTDVLHGVKYTEEYRYFPDDEIDEMVKDGTFQSYITNDVVEGKEFTKASFDVTSSISNSTTIINGNEIEFSYMPTQFETYTTVEKDNTFYPLVRLDYYDGIGYTPKVTNRVRFSRGNSAAFERHLKLGEIKSFDDFLNYSNGGFFNIL